VASVFSSLESIYYKSKHGLFFVPANAHEESGADGGELGTSDLDSDLASLAGHYCNDDDYDNAANASAALPDTEHLGEGLHYVYTQGA
jgi:hypothetical protein